MKIKSIKDLIEQFDQTSLTELHWQEGDFNLHLSKLDNPLNLLPVNPEKSNSLSGNKGENVENLTQSAQQEVEKPHQLEESKNEESKEDLASITSPLVGVVYLQETPDTPVFKEVGDRVEVGETVCIVEAMKLMNEIQSDISGIITEITVKNEEVVAFNQPLFRVKEG